MSPTLARWLLIPCGALYITLGVIKHRLMAGGRTHQQENNDGPV